MINERSAKEYCCEDISKIENYEQAVADQSQTWDIHHRRGIDECKTPDQLKAEGLYDKRPADELIFLTHGEHKRLHNQGKHLSDEHKKKLSEAQTNDQKKSKPVQQLAKTTGELLATFLSMAEAERATGVARSNICRCCCGKCKQAGGFIWKYAKDFYLK